MTKRPALTGKKMKTQPWEYFIDDPRYRAPWTNKIYNPAARGDKHYSPK